MNINVLILGGTGLVGSAFKRYFENYGGCNVYAPSRAELDLQKGYPEILHYMHKNEIDRVICAAAYVGGIIANSKKPYEFLYCNLQIQNSVIEAFKLYQENYNQCAQLLFLGSTCIYPKKAQASASEEDLLRGDLEPSNEAYALAKICGIRMAQQVPNTFCVMPCNLFGINDTYDEFQSHVIPALILKTIKARKENAEYIKIGGLGKGIKRQFMLADDLATICDQLMDDHDSIDLINIGAPHAIPLDDIARIIRDIIYPKGKLFLDETIPLGVISKEAKIDKLKKLLPNLVFKKFSHQLKWTIEHCPKVYELLKGVWVDIDLKGDL